MIDDVAIGIVEKFNENVGIKKALSGGLYFQQAPQNVSYPYGVFYFSGMSQEEIMGSAFNNITEIELQFNFFSDADDGGEDIAKLAELFDEAYHWQTLNIDGWRNPKTQRDNYGPLIYTDNIWQATIFYILWMQTE